MIRKLKSGQYRLYSRKVDPKTGKRRNLGTFASRSAAEQHEREVRSSNGGAERCRGRRAALTVNDRQIREGQSALLVRRCGAHMDGLDLESAVFASRACEKDRRECLHRYPRTPSFRRKPESECSTALIFRDIRGSDTGAMDPGFRRDDDREVRLFTHSQNAKGDAQSMEALGQASSRRKCTASRPRCRC